MFYSPLRYPGGKNKLSGFIAKMCEINKIDGHYVEPYAGGASVALYLLIEGFVKEITINDKDRSIYAFWYSVLNHSNELCQKIQDTDITVGNWLIQRDIQKNKEHARLLDLGFSTLYMNRCNHSGIINGGILGGKNQNGDYKIDCRFNKSAIISRITKIAALKDRIHLYNDDAIDLIDRIEKYVDHNTVFYFDPPYYLKANSLYMNHYQDEHHKQVAKRIQQIENIQWIVSYDNVPYIQEIYSGCSKKEYAFKHTAYKARVGQEILFFSSKLKHPENQNWNPLNFKLSKSDIIYINNN